MTIYNTENTQLTQTLYKLLLHVYFQLIQTLQIL